MSAGVSTRLSRPRFISRGDARLATWIARIVYRHAPNHIRRRRAEAGFDEASYASASGVDSSERLTERIALEQAIAKPAPHERAVITLYHYHGMPYDQIANVVSRPVGTVKTWLHRARARLKAELSLD